MLYPYFALVLYHIILKNVDSSLSYYCRDRGEPILMLTDGIGGSCIEFCEGDMCHLTIAIEYFTFTRRECKHLASSGSCLKVGATA